MAQLIGSLLASGTLSLLFDVDREAFFGTVPNGPHGRSLVAEIITTFLLMFVVCGAATDSRAVSNFPYQYTLFIYYLTTKVEFFLSGRRTEAWLGSPLE